MQKDFNLVWCCGTVKEKIFQPWMDSLESKGCKFIRSKITDVTVDDTNCLSNVICGRERYEADAVVFAIGISALQELIHNSYGFISLLITVQTGYTFIIVTYFWFVNITVLIFLVFCSV